MDEMNNNEASLPEQKDKNQESMDKISNQTQKDLAEVNRVVDLCDSSVREITNDINNILLILEGDSEQIPKDNNKNAQLEDASTTLEDSRDEQVLNPELMMTADTDHISQHTLQDDQLNQSSSQKLGSIVAIHQNVADGAEEESFATSAGNLLQLAADLLQPTEQPSHPLEDDLLSSGTVMLAKDESSYSVSELLDTVPEIEYKHSLTGTPKVSLTSDHTCNQPLLTGSEPNTPIHKLSTESRSSLPDTRPQASLATPINGRKPYFRSQSDVGVIKSHSQTQLFTGEDGGSVSLNIRIELGLSGFP